MPGASSEALAVSKYVRSVEIDRTKRGLVFLAFGIVVSALPVVRPAGAIISLAGAIWYVSGHHIFGEKHSKYVTPGAVFFVIGLALLLIGSIGYLTFVLSTVTFIPANYWGNDALATALAPSLSTIFAVEATGAIFTGIAYTLFTFYVQKPIGRALLLGSLAATFVLSILIFSILNSNLYAPLAPCEPGSPYYCRGYSLLYPNYPGSYDQSAAGPFETQALVVSLLNLVPAVVYALACYTTYDRVNKGELT